MPHWLRVILFINDESIEMKTSWELSLANDVFIGYRIIIQWQQ